MERSATAVWNGGLKDGKGSISTPSGVLSDSPYSFLTRFENAKGTNPEELIGAAHAACFAMALSAQLGTMNFTAGEDSRDGERDARKTRRRLDHFENPSGRSRAHPWYF